MRSTEQAKAHSRSHQQKTQALRLKFLSPALFEWFELDLSDGSLYSLLLAAWGVGISCLMEMLKSSLCVHWEMHEYFARSQPRQGRAGTAARPEQWGVPVQQCPTLWVTGVGSPGCRESPRWDHVDMPSLRWITCYWNVPAPSNLVSHISCLGWKS